MHNHNLRLFSLGAFLATCALSSVALADQPIFDEMPRWNDGWGVQVLYEYRHSQHLLKGPKALLRDTPESVHLMHVEGVYTFTKAYRVTVKVPVILDATRVVLNEENKREEQKDRGLGDPILTIPLKSYFNLDGRSGSWTFAPHVKIPGGKREAYNPQMHFLGAGLGLGYSTETYKHHFGVSLSSWYFGGQQPATLALNLGAGFNFQAFGSVGHFKIKSTSTIQSDETIIINAGPTFYWRFTDLWHGQIQWRHTFYENQTTIIRHGDYDSFRVGLGVVF